MFPLGPISDKQSQPLHPEAPPINLCILRGECRNVPFSLEEPPLKLNPPPSPHPQSNCALIVSDGWPILPQRVCPLRNNKNIKRNFFFYSSRYFCVPFFTPSRPANFSTGECPSFCPISSLPEWLVPPHFPVSLFFFFVNDAWSRLLQCLWKARQAFAPLPDYPQFFCFSLWRCYPHPRSVVAIKSLFYLSPPP